MVAFASLQHLGMSSRPNRARGPRMGERRRLRHYSSHRRIRTPPLDRAPYHKALRPETAAHSPFGSPLSPAASGSSLPPTESSTLRAGAGKAQCVGPCQEAALRGRRVRSPSRDPAACDGPTARRRLEAAGSGTALDRHRHDEALGIAAHPPARSRAVSSGPVSRLARHCHPADGHRKSVESTNAQKQRVLPCCFHVTIEEIQDLERPLCRKVHPPIAAAGSTEVLIH